MSWLSDTSTLYIDPHPSPRIRVCVCVCVCVCLPLLLVCVCKIRLAFCFESPFYYRSLLFLFAKLNLLLNIY